MTVNIMLLLATHLGQKTQIIKLSYDGLSLYFTFHSVIVTLTVAEILI